MKATKILSHTETEQIIFFWSLHEKQQSTSDLSDQFSSESKDDIIDDEDDEEDPEESS